MSFQHFRNSLVSAFVLLSAMLFSGCDNAEDATPAPDNHIVIEGKKYEINDFILSSSGPKDLVYHDNVEKDTHYMFILTLSDGEITLPNGPTATNSSYLISIYLYTTIADHTEAFTGGEFGAVHPQDYFGGKSPEFENFFTAFFIRLDTNGNSRYDSKENDKFMDASIGTISSTGSGENFTFTFDNTINDPDPATPVTGKFDGTVRLVIN